MDFKKLKELNSSQRVAKAYTLEELIAGAREYKIISDNLEARRLELEKDAERLKNEQDKLRHEMGEISFGGLLLNAIGIKIRDGE